MNAIVFLLLRRVQDAALSDLHERFKGAVGAKLKLRVRGDRAERVVTHILGDQV